MLQPRFIFLAEFSDSAVSRIGDEVRVIRHQDITDYLEGPFKPLLGKNGEELDATALLGE